MRYSHVQCASCRELARRNYARCPGCQDLGDAEHIAACVSSRLAAAHWDGALAMLLIIEKQLHRRRGVDFGRLVRAAEFLKRPRTKGR